MQDIATTPPKQRRSGRGKSLAILALLSLILGLAREYANAPDPDYPLYVGAVVGAVAGLFIVYFFIGAVVFGIVRRARYGSASPMAGLASGLIAILLATALALYEEHTLYLRDHPELRTITQRQD